MVLHDVSLLFLPRRFLTEGHPKSPIPVAPAFTDLNLKDSELSNSLFHESVASSAYRIACLQYRRWRCSRSLYGTVSAGRHPSSSHLYLLRVMMYKLANTCADRTRSSSHPRLIPSVCLRPRIQRRGEDDDVSR